MSRLSDLIRQAKSADSQLGADLEREFRALTKRRSFGLVFERHQPEAVELPGRPVRKGDKVHILPERGKATRGDQRLWTVSGFNGQGEDRTAQLVYVGRDDDAESVTKLVADLIVVAEFRDHIYPGLVETGRVEQGGDKPFHTVINAENFHALEMLTYTHHHAVDAIYIDPPYNTGAKDWKYNNDYVESDDDYRHSKWLAMMERRLLIAGELLNPDESVLVVTIDEKEYLRLGLLLEQLFPEARIQMVTIVINPNGVARGAELARVEEYAYFLFFGSAAPSRSADTLLDQGRTTPRSAVRWEWLMRGGSNSRRIDRPNLFYPIYIDDERQTIVEVGEAIPLGQDTSSVEGKPGLRTLWPIRVNGQEANWRTSPEYLRAMLEQGYAKLGAYDARTDRWSVLYLGRAQQRRIADGEITVVGRDDAGAVVLEQDRATVRMVPKTVWNRSQHSAGEHGSRMLRAMLPGRGFPFPKSLYAVEDTLRVMVGDKPNAVVLDFFAGSGTTAHAVMRLNRKDNGRRQCISVTNNEVSADEQTRLRRQGLRPGDEAWEELGVCDYITKPRITAAIKGVNLDGESVQGEYRFNDEFPIAEGLAENAAFFTLTYEGPLSVAHHRAFARIAPMLWLRAGACGRIISDLSGTHWDVSENYGVLDDLDAAAGFVAKVKAQPGVRMVFIVTDDDLAFQMVCRELPKRVRPVQLYESYVQNFEISSGRFA